SVLSGPFCLASVKACAPSWWSCCSDTAPTYWVRPVDEGVAAQADRTPTITSAARECCMDVGSGYCRWRAWRRRSSLFGNRACSPPLYADFVGLRVRCRMSPPPPPPAAAPPGAPRATSTPGSDVEVGHLERVVLDELAPRLHHVPHQGAEDLVGGHRVLDPHL